MQILAALPFPQLPQMVDDGFITQTELESIGGVIVNISRYSNAAKGDYLCLYFDGELFNTLSLADPDTYLWPWSTVIPVSGDSWPADGPHQVWYTAIDAVLNPSTSPVSVAVIDRQHTDGLPPPTFPDADATNTVTYGSVTQNSGTHVRIPWSTDAYSAGDTIYLYWREFDAAGNLVAGSDTSITHTVVSQDVGKGFKMLVPSPFVTAVITTGRAEAWYSVIPQSGLAKSSQVGNVTVDMTGSGIYPAPFIPAGNDGWIDCSEITVDGTEVDIPASPQFVVGGGVVVYWQGYDASGIAIPATTWQSSVHSLTQNDLTAGFSVRVPADVISPVGIGFAQAWYAVSSPALPGVSGMASVRVDARHCTQLPAPVFPAAAGDNTITGEEITADNGTELNVAYPGMVAGDIVTAFWTGYQNSPDNPVPGATWTQTRTLSATEEQSQLAIFHIPAGNITPVGTGYGEGSYNVKYNNQGGTASSAPTQVQLKQSSSSGLQMSCTTGAPVFNPTVMVRPLNTVTLSGPAGVDVELSLATGSDAWFDPDGLQTRVIRLDSTGRGYAEVYAFTTGNVLVSAYVVTNPALSASASMTFTDWLPGNSDLQFYGITSGAVADGKTPCSVWLMTASSTQASQARLTLTSGNAVITQSGTQVAYINISASHAGGFDVTDLTAENVNFTLSLPDVSGAYVTQSLSFVAPFGASL
ncbi:hypothetical protein [Citrobacter amalonaticus]|uniref:hypothetical protein n=1 Tax=Citrobacter amalonaticus TaxID=35703 RepID=UPI00300C7117